MMIMVFNLEAQKNILSCHSWVPVYSMHELSAVRDFTLQNFIVGSYAMYQNNTNKENNQGYLE